MAWTSKLPLFACACILILSAYVIYDLNGKSFDFSDKQVVLIVSDSMDGDNHEYAIGSFPADTLVMVQHLPDNEKRFLRVGDVIAYKDGSILMHHRIVQVNPDSVYVHGDNNHSTEIVSYEGIDGKVVGTNWILGHVLAFIEGHFLAFLGIMFALCCGLILCATHPFATERKEEAE